MKQITRRLEVQMREAMLTSAGYRRARWRSIVLYGLAGCGKTTVARSLAEDDKIRAAFREGVIWIDGTHQQDTEIERICKALGLQLQPGERWDECWRRWARSRTRRFLLVLDDVADAATIRTWVSELGTQVVALVTTRRAWMSQTEITRWMPFDTVSMVRVGGLPPDEGKRIVEAELGRDLKDEEWPVIQEVGEELGWHAGALALTAYEGRAVGWRGIADELKAGHMPLREVGETIREQVEELPPDERSWLMDLLKGTSPGWHDVAAAAVALRATEAIAIRRMWLLSGTGTIETEGVTEQMRWRAAPIVRRSLLA
jgi:hypothetical protein